MASPPTSHVRRGIAGLLVAVVHRWALWVAVGLAFLSLTAGASEAQGLDAPAPRNLVSITLPTGGSASTGEDAKALSSSSQTGSASASGLQGDVGRIVQRVETAVSQAQDLQMQVRMDLINPESGSVTKARAYLRARLPELIRLDFLEPDMLRGMILVVDVAANQALQFHPVTEQVIVQPWDRLARERGLQLEFERWLGLPDPEQYEFRRLPDRQQGDVSYVALEGVPREGRTGMRYEFLIHPTRWWVEHIRLYDAQNRLIFTAWLDEIVVNQGIGEADLRALPQDAEVIRL